MLSPSYLAFKQGIAADTVFFFYFDQKFDCHVALNNQTYMINQACFLPLHTTTFLYVSYMVPVNCKVIFGHSLIYRFLYAKML